MLESFENQLDASLERLNVRSGGVLVAVSGGADSMALLHGLRAVSNSLELALHVAHLDHGLRGAESAADAEWLRRESTSLALPVTIEHRDVGVAAAAACIGLEEAARSERYSFFIRAAEAAGCRWVAVAHTADDQVETILHHILRGTGLDGLRGMPLQRPLTGSITLIRPLLDARRADVEDYLRNAGHSWRSDSTNADRAFTRNRIRHTLLPLLRAEFNPQVDDALLRLGRQSADVSQVIRAAAVALLERCRADATPEVVRIDCRPLADAPPHLVRAMFHSLWSSQAWPARELNSEHLETLAALAQARGGAVHLPGLIHAARRGTLLVLTREK